MINLDKVRQYRWNIFKLILKKIGTFLGLRIESYFLMKYELNKFDIESKIASFDYSDVQEFYLVDLQDSPLFDLHKKNIFKERFALKTYSCYGIMNKDEICYITWISWKKMNYPNTFQITERLESNEALLLDSTCNPKYRGLGYHSKMNVFRLNTMLKNNIKTAVALVEGINTPALNVQIKSGFKITHKLSSLSFFRMHKLIKTKINAKCKK